MENIETSRTKIHEQALVCIFQYLFYDEFVSNEYKKRIEEIISDTTKTKYDDCDPFFKAIIFETIKNKKDYIEIISSKLNKWTYDRLCLTDQAILLLFCSEIMNNRVPIQVGIDVAVDFAHKYCDDGSYRYINKVLDRIGKENAK